MDYRLRLRVPDWNIRDTTLLSLLALLTLVVRAPFWGRAVIDWDESTFILMGQSLLDGNLLYTKLWDIKPPLLFVVFAAFIAFLGKTIVAIRLGGALIVYATAVLTFFVIRRSFDRSSACVGATAYILAASLFYGGQCTFSEHIAVLPLMAGAAILTMGPATSVPRILAFGLCLSTAALVRHNLAIVYFVGALIVTAMVSARQPQPWSVVSYPVAYAIGGLAPVGLSLAPYLATHSFDVWWNAVIAAPLSFSRPGALESTFALFRNLAFNNAFMFLFCALAVIGLWSTFADKPSGGRWRVIILAIIACSVAISILLSGHHEHYVLQILPLLAVFGGAGGSVIFRRSGSLAPLVIVFATLLVGYNLRPVIHETLAAAKRILGGQGFVYGDAVEVADFIRELRLGDYSVFAMSDHIVYWLLDREPPTRVAHPSNIFRPALLAAVHGPGATPASEFERILEQRPTVVVKRRRVWFMGGFERERGRLKVFLEGYILAFCSGRLDVHVRSDVWDGVPGSGCSRE